MRSLLFALFVLGCGEKPPVDTGPGADLDADGYVTAEDGGDDCDDANAAIHPGVDEVCDGVDNDCDGAVDEGDALDAPTWYDDGDGDGFGDPEVTAVVCDAPAGFIADSSDCDDDEDFTFPGADELCDGADNDCDGVVDEDTVDPPTWYADTDGDGYGDATVSQVACPAPEGFVADDTDCDDSDSEIHPGAEEVCNDAVDNDCDGALSPCSLSLEEADLTLTGDAEGDLLGAAVAPVGDVDGDGNPDLLLGAPGALTGQGAAYLVYGPVTDSGTAEVSTIAGARLLGAVEQAVGYSVAGGGDLDGDGLDDLVLSSSVASSAAGLVWVVTEAPLGDLDLADAPIVLQGESEDDYAGVATWVAGDLDADGNDDLVVGACTADSAVDRVGAAYVLYGPIAPGSASLGAADAIVRGVEGDSFLGYAGARVGDVDGDGNDDLLTGAYGTEAFTGAVYLHLGPVVGSASVGDADLALMGEAEEDAAGVSLGHAGDFDGDGYADILVGAPGVDADEQDIGAVYLVRGPGFSGSLADADLKILGERRGGGFGDAMAAGADLDGDGQPDIAVGAPGVGSSWQGAVYVFSGPLTGTLTVADAVVVLPGKDVGGAAGHALAVVPGFDGADGAGLVIGAYSATTDEELAGEAYVLSGLGV